MARQGVFNDSFCQMQLKFKEHNITQIYIHSSLKASSAAKILRNAVSAVSLIRLLTDPSLFKHQYHPAHNKFNRTYHLNH